MHDLTPVINCNALMIRIPSRPQHVYVVRDAAARKKRRLVKGDKDRRYSTLVVLYVLPLALVDFVIAVPETVV